MTNITWIDNVAFIGDKEVAELKQHRDGSWYGELLGSKMLVDIEGTKAATRTMVEGMIARLGTVK